jgi:glycerol uptake facilitator-like aquaporin
VALTFAVIDEFNAPVKANLAPLALGLVVVAIGISLGAHAGYAIIPARDRGPRLLTWIARGTTPHPENADEGRTAVDEPGGATG